MNISGIDRRAFAVRLGGLIAAAVAFAFPALGASSKVTVGVHRHMEATLIAPDGPGPYPAVLVLHTSGGLKSADIEYAERLSKEGYVCLVPAFMAAYGITGRTRRDTFTTYARDVYDDLVSAIETLRRNEKVDGEKVAALGFSNGGYFATWLAATAKVDAGVAYYGAFSGAGTDIELTRFSSTFSAASAPVLILHGEADRTVPVAAAERLSSIVKRAGSPYEIHLYPGADHGFERDLKSEDTKVAAEDAWSRTQAFLGKWLRPR